MTHTNRTRWIGLLVLISAVLAAYGPAGCSTDSQADNSQSNGSPDDMQNGQANASDNGQSNASDQDNDNESVACATEDPDATMEIAGTYRYDGGGMNAITQQTFTFSGTITFEQDGNMVRVSDTTYDSVGLRRVDGEFVELMGNEFETTLTPISGDSSYAAQVRFVFDDDGDSFCVAFMDSNNDMGELGSFTGFRMAR